MAREHKMNEMLQIIITNEFRRLRSVESNRLSTEMQPFYFNVPFTCTNAYELQNFTFLEYTYDMKSQLFKLQEGVQINL